MEKEFKIIKVKPKTHNKLTQLKDLFEYRSFDSLIRNLMRGNKK